MATVDKVKILVVGDSGVGKTSLVHLICNGQPIAKPSWTIGCSVEVKLHEYKEGTPQQMMYFLELWDVGGSSSHSNSRTVFYNSLQGIILAHDLTNKKSQMNLGKWLSEVLCKEGNGKKSSNGYDPEQFVEQQVPVLVIGTKLDLAQRVLSPGRTSRSSSFSEDCGAEEIFVDCHQAKSLAPGSSNAVKLSRFFDKVIERRYHSHAASPISAIVDRRRMPPPTVNKFSHMD